MCVKHLKKKNVCKVPGPDNISPKACTYEMTDIITDSFNFSLCQSVVLTCFKKPPLPQDQRNQTWVAIKTHITASLLTTLDRLQFIYRQNRSPDDVIVFTLHCPLPPGPEKKTFVCECCSLTTAQLLIPSCNPGLSWSSMSCASVLPWGRSQTVPQHWCPSWTCAQPLAVQPVHTWLHSLTHSFKIVIKFADYTTIISCITDGNESDYRAEVKVLALWCQDNNLLLNISKMKELIMDCRRQYEAPCHASIHIEGTELL